MPRPTCGRGIRTKESKRTQNKIKLFSSLAAYLQLVLHARLSVTSKVCNQSRGRLQWHRLEWQLLTVTVLTGPSWSFIHKKEAVRVTVGYSDTFPMSRGCHSNQLGLYIFFTPYSILNFWLQWHSWQFKAICEWWNFLYFPKMAFHSAK